MQDLAGEVREGSILGNLYKVDGGRARATRNPRDAQLSAIRSPSKTLAIPALNVPSLSQTPQ